MGSEVWKYYNIFNLDDLNDNKKWITPIYIYISKLYISAENNRICQYIVLSFLFYQSNTAEYYIYVRKYYNIFNLFSADYEVAEVNLNTSRMKINLW